MAEIESPPSVTRRGRNIDARDTAVQRMAHPGVSDRQRRYLDVNDLAEQLGISAATLYRWRSDGTDMPKAFKIGGRVRWDQASVDTWISAQMAKTA